MNKLTEIIRSLNKQEARNFKIFEKRIGAEKFEKKMLKLYDYIRTGKFEEHDDLLVEKLYPPRNKNAYYRLKNRLINDLQKSLIEFHLGVDKRMKVLGTIMLARIFYYKANYQLSYSYLIKAEKQAVESAAFNLLNLIYDEIIALSKYYYEIDPSLYIKLKERRNQEYAQIQQVDYLMASINHRLHKTNFTDSGTTVLEELELLQQQFRLLPKDQSQAVRIEIHKVVRNILLSKKDFESLESYLLESYEGFLKEDFFAKSNHREKIILLTWVINTLNKNQKFHEAATRLDELKQILLDYNKLYYDNYIWTYNQSLVFNLSQSDRNEEAITLLEGLKKKKNNEGTQYYIPFIYISLVTLYYNIADYTKATKNLNYLLHTSQYQVLSPDMRLGLAIAEIVIRIDMEDWNYAYSRLKALKRSHRTILNKEDYKQEKSFVSILGNIVGQAEAFQQPKVKNKIKEFLDSASLEIGSHNPIDYIVWLKSKIEGKNYYDIYLGFYQQG